jgi:hypothetical protein
MTVTLALKTSNVGPVGSTCFVCGIRFSLSRTTTAGFPTLFFLNVRIYVKGVAFGMTGFGLFHRDRDANRVF